MILQALVRLYEDLLVQGKIARPGWGPEKISFALCLNREGELLQVIPTLQELTTEKKTVLRPQEPSLPAAVKRSSGITSNFLWDNSSYLLGVDQKGKPQRSLDCFSAASALHHTILNGIESPAATAILKFFDAWQPENASEHPALMNRFDEITAGGNLMFRIDGVFAQDDPAIQDAWQRYQGDKEEDVVRMQCLVTGQEDEIPATHPFIKGVRNAQSSGAALVTFNEPAFCSYGREQNFNAPVGKYAAFAYTTALNHLLADRDNVQRIGDTTVVCWAEGADPAYRPLVLGALFGQEQPAWTEKDLRDTVKRLANQEPVEEYGLDPDRTFYILGLAPNAARLSVRFFFRDTFGNLMKHINAHHERMEIVRPAYDPYPTIPLWAMLRETVNQNTKDKEPSPVMAGATARAIFSGGPYPAALLTGVMLRIRAERNITRGRAAILKAYLKRNVIEEHREHDPAIEEVADVYLNEECTYMPYVLGRLFFVMEQMQRASANWEINRTIKDSYFNAAATTPRNAFVKLLPLSEHHLKKLLRDMPGLGITYKKAKTDLMAKITAPIPVRFTQEETICFYLGYYHQEANKKEEKKNG